MKIHSRQKEAETEVRQTEEPCVSRVANGHVGVLQEVHIARKEEIDSVANRYYDLVIMELVKLNEKKMHERNHKKRYQKPKLRARVGDRTV